MTRGLYFRPDASLDQMVAMCRDINKELEISPEGLHQRITQSGVEFLKVMLSRALELSVSRLIDKSVPRILEHFVKVHLLDSTQVSLPEELSEIWSGSGGCASESSMKLHLMLDYKSGQYENIAITDGTSPDQNYNDGDYGFPEWFGSPSSMEHEKKGIQLPEGDPSFPGQSSQISLPDDRSCRSSQIPFG